MSTQTSDNNKRIAKNTLMLYIRMLFMMGISLYTSRVVLNTLGVENYGIYNVVGGIVSMFGFINGSMSSASQRYITFALGKSNQSRLSTIFSTTLQIHTAIALIIVLLGETIGVWFLYNKMQIPPERLDAAFWVIQCSVISMVVSIVSVPYNANIVAHERMSAFAYISIIEAVLKLTIVYLLATSPFDKLIAYAVLLLLVQVLISLCYICYCNKHFGETKYKHIWDKTLFKEMMGFAEWSMFGNLAAVLFGQGLNILLNVFFGPVVNAARGVAVQVQSAIQQFVGNFQTALNPQITKTYAQGDLRSMHNLMYRSARFSFFLLFSLSLPILLETNFILKLWLNIVPNDTVPFLRIMICTSLIYTLSNPLMIANQATGNIKSYQAICGSIQLLILPISYFLLYLGFPAFSVFIVHFTMECITQFARMLLLRPMIKIRISDYISNIYRPVLMVVIVSIIMPFIIYFTIQDDTYLKFLLVLITSLISVMFFSYKLGLSSEEKTFIKAIINRYFKK